MGHCTDSGRDVPLGYQCRDLSVMVEAIAQPRAEPIARREILPQMALQMIRVGEESGALDTMLAKVAAIYDKETQASVKRMLTLLEPLLIIGLGILVAGIIISIIVPILGANELVM